MKATFLRDDPFGAWAKGETAEYLGRESNHPLAPPIFLFRFQRPEELRGSILALTSPFSRGLVALEDGSVPDDTDEHEAMR